jgi:hypothetical protein
LSVNCVRVTLTPYPTAAAALDFVAEIMDDRFKQKHEVFLEYTEYEKDLCSCFEASPHLRDQTETTYNRSVPTHHPKPTHP